MSLNSSEIVIGVIIAFAFALGIARIICHFSVFYKNSIDQELISARHHSIDGLRGYLATGVILHHIFLNHHFYLTGKWELTSSRFSTFLGRGSVAIFFMITAFLFWTQMIERKDRFDAMRFYQSRIRRLVPMYLVSASLVAVTAIAFTKFRLNVPVGSLVAQIVSWLLFTFPGAPAINGYDSTGLINGVFWTLVYEWKFYLILPLIGALALQWGTWLVGLGVCVCILLLSATHVEWYFVAGCAAAIIVRFPTPTARSRGIFSAILGIVCMLAAIIWRPMIYEFGAAVLLFITFVIIVQGNTFFGLLTNKAARLLGLLSYSIYLLHNWVLFLMARLINHYVPIAELSHAAYLMLGVGVICITVMLAALTYRFVEFPLLRASRAPAGV
jgi:peptidoglycan/LPS O-acetylase OafA/YrhL